MTDGVRLILGEAEAVLPTLEAGTVDAVICDPPYPCIKRSYGYWTEAEWFAMMRRVVPECMRVLKPTGSAVFILQPNSERVGRMRTWLWEFMLWVGKEWGIVQDAYWWNPVTLPAKGSSAGLLRSSVKPCVWIGPSGCYRSSTDVLWGQGEWHRTEKAIARAGIERPPSGHRIDVQRCTEAAKRRGGVSPYNLLPFANNRTSGDDAGAHGHGAGTPSALCQWWVRYLTPPAGVVLDPFSGSGTVPLAALAEGRSAIGIERIPEYHQIALRRLGEERAKHPLFPAED